jgi:hypothetical protein
MLTPGGVFIGIAAAVIVTIAVFLFALAIAGIRRRRGQPVGPSFGRLLAFLGGVVLGTLYLVNAGPAAMVPLLLFVAGLVVSTWRSGRRTYGGWHLTGAALPWTILWGIYVMAMLQRVNNFEVVPTWLGFLAGLIPLCAGLGLVLSGDRAAPALRSDSHRWAPGSRTIGTVATAIRGPSAIGPFGLSEVLAMVAIVVVLFPLGLASFFLRVPDPIRIAIIALVAAVVGTETYIRAMPRQARLPFEALSWEGEWELRRLREQTGEGPPLRADAADRWLDRHPDEPGIRWVRAEVLIIAQRLDDALATALAIPAETPEEVVERQATLELVRWMRGENSDLSELEAAVAAVPPGDDRLRAEVQLAVARVRLRMVDGRTEPGDAAAPLIEVRALLGSRADGQVGRALRKRLLPFFLVTGVAFGILQLFLDATGLMTIV